MCANLVILVKIVNMLIMANLVNLMNLANHVNLVTLVNLVNVVILVNPPPPIYIFFASGSTLHQPTDYSMSLYIEWVTSTLIFFPPRLGHQPNPSSLQLTLRLNLSRQ